MYILMDMEWITMGTRVCPTQISALKVDRYYHQIGRVDMLIKPFSTAAEKWDNMAYNGYPPQSFLSAPTAAAAFNRVSSWINDDDTMIWWIRDQAVSFSMLHASLLKEKPRYAITYISPVVQKAFRSGGYKEKLSLYGAASRLNITASGPEHCSKSDVDILRAILLPSPLTRKVPTNWMPVQRIAQSGRSQSPFRNESFHTHSTMMESYCTWERARR